MYSVFKETIRLYWQLRVWEPFSVLQKRNQTAVNEVIHLLY